MTTTDKQDARIKLAQYRVESSQCDAADVIADMADVLERAAVEIRRYEERYREAETDADRSFAISSAVNYITTGILNNIRLDLTLTKQLEVVERSAELAALVAENDD